MSESWARVGFGLSGGLSLTAPLALGLMEQARAAGLSPVLATEVAGLSATDLIAAFAARNPAVVTGTGIVPLGSRSTAAIAMAARTITQVSGTRFLLGVGVSTPPIVTGWHGQVHDASMDTTARRLAELRSLLRGEARGSFALPEDGGQHIQVLLGALGPRMVELGLTRADGVILNHTPPHALPTAVPQGATVLAYVWVLACTDGDQRARRDLVSYAMAEPYARHFTRLGFGDAVDEVRRLHAEGRLRDAPARLPQAMVDALFVHPDGLLARLERVHDADATPVVMPVTGQDPVSEIAMLLSSLPAEWAIPRSDLTGEGVAGGVWSPPPTAQI